MLISRQIHQEYFFFNRVYNSLIMKREKILNMQEEDPQYEEKARMYMMALPSLNQKVRYRHVRSRLLSIDNVRERQLSPILGNIVNGSKSKIIRELK